MTFKIINILMICKSLYTRNISKFALRESLCTRKKPKPLIHIRES